MNQAKQGITALVRRYTVAVLFGGCVASAMAAVQTPTITGPLGSGARGAANHNYTYMTTDLDLASRGYVEQEFYSSGTANVYDTPLLIGGIGLGPAAGTANVVSSGHPYKTRMIVRRPTDPARFNGTVIVEWINTTSAFDNESFWLRVHEFVLREGYGYVGVSVQNQGISGTPNGLKAWSPLRYGSLDVTDNGTVANEGLSYDVFGQAMQAVKTIPAVMGGLPVRRVLAAGVSQSAGRIALYINTVHPRDPVADGAVLFIGGQQIRSDLNIPVIKILSETEHGAPAAANQVCSNLAPPASCGTSLQTDTDRIRVWIMAGVSHMDWESYLARNALTRRDLVNVNLYDTCGAPSRSRIQDQYVLDAGIDAMRKWVETGVAPPHSPSLQMVSTSPDPQIARDANGNALGGIRLASFAVPIALDQGNDIGAGNCYLFGIHQPFDTAKLAALYPSHDAYVNAITQAATQNVRDGFLLPADAQELIADASASIVGTGLTCGPLCANVAQFPLNPSTTLLRDQTASYHFVGGRSLLSTVDAATKSVAEGYTAAEQTDAVSQGRSKQSFAQALAALRTYIGQVQALAAQGTAPAETAALLIDFANTLIERIAFEGKISDPHVAPGPDASIRIVEFTRAASQQFFWGSDPAERAILDKSAGDWTRTGASFNAWADLSTAPAATVPVCRFYGKANGPMSHLFIADPAECAAIKNDTHWTYEGLAFRAMPVTNGACPYATVAVLRLWKAGATPAASRHRFVVDPRRAAKLVNFEGWTLEGPVFCVMQSD